MKMKKRQNSVMWVDCECEHPQHSIRFYLDKTGPLEDPVLSIQKLPTPTGSFWQRLIVGLKYIFTGDSYYSDTILAPSEVAEVVKVITIYKVLLKLRRAKRERFNDHELS